MYVPTKSKEAKIDLTIRQISQSVPRHLKLVKHPFRVSSEMMGLEAEKKKTKKRHHLLHYIFDVIL